MQNAEIIELKKQLLERDIIIEKLQFELDQLKRIVFGKTSEKVDNTGDKPNEYNQMALFEQEKKSLDNVEIEQSIQAHTRTITRTNNPVRKGLPENLRREIIVLNPENVIEGSRKIGEEITEILEYKKPEIYVKQYVRPKYSIPGQEGIAIAKLPERIVNKGIFGNSIMAHVIVSKFVDHIPLHRQVNIFSRLSTEISYNTLVENVNKFGSELIVFRELIQEQIRQSNYRQLDESTLKVMNEGKKGNSHLGYMWVSHAPRQNLVLFEYHPSRSGQVAKSIMEGSSGYLQTDGYSAYHQFNENKDIIHMYCMAHVRRKFFEALQYNKNISQYAMDIIAKLYGIEKIIREANLNDIEILSIRQKESIPILDEFKTFLLENKIKSTPSSPIGKAINYAINCFDGLTVYTTQPQLQIDNNLIENKIRPLALGRKNYMFAGNHQAAENTATFYSLIACCQLNNVCPQRWFETVFEKLPQEKINNLQYLMPNSDFWKS